MATGATLLEFPADITVKAMGKAADDFEAHVHHLVSAHLSSDEAITVSVLASRKGKYVSVRVRFIARCQQQLEAIYRELHECDRVLFTL